MILDVLEGIVGLRLLRQWSGVFCMCTLRLWSAHSLWKFSFESEGVWYRGAREVSSLSEFRKSMGGEFFW